jgi:hypothetical protein
MPVSCCFESLAILPKNRLFRDAVHERPFIASNAWHMPPWQAFTCEGPE